MRLFLPTKPFRQLIKGITTGLPDHASQPVFTITPSRVVAQVGGWEYHAPMKISTSGLVNRLKRQPVTFLLDTPLPAVADGIPVNAKSLTVTINNDGRVAVSSRNTPVAEGHVAPLVNGQLFPDTDGHVIPHIVYSGAASVRLFAAPYEAVHQVKTIASCDKGVLVSRFVPAAQDCTTMLSTPIDGTETAGSGSLAGVAVFRLNTGQPVPQLPPPPWFHTVPIPVSVSIMQLLSRIPDRSLTGLVCSITKEATHSLVEVGLTSGHVWRIATEMGDVRGFTQVKDVVADQKTTPEWNITIDGEALSAQLQAVPVGPTLTLTLDAESNQLVASDGHHTASVPIAHGDVFDDAVVTVQTEPFNEVLAAFPDAALTARKSMDKKTVGLNLEAVLFTSPPQIMQFVFTPAPVSETEPDGSAGGSVAMAVATGIATGTVG